MSPEDDHTLSVSALVAGIQCTALISAANIGYTLLHNQGINSKVCTSIEII